MNRTTVTCLAALSDLLLAAGCGAPAAPLTPAAAGGDLSQLQAQTASVVSLRFTTATAIPQNPPPALDITVNDAAKVQALYQATLALSAVPKGVNFNCPADAGVTYQLSFSSSSGVVLQANLDPGGCEFVLLLGPDLELSGGQAAYWAQIAATLGINESQIYPYLPPGI